MNPSLEILDSGINCVIESQARRRNAAVGLLVHTGARDEPPGANGISHFLEHLAYKGTAVLTAAQLNRRYDELGAYVNAFTAEEATCFYACVPEEGVSEAVKLLFDMMRPSLPEKEVEHERGVVLEEIAMSRDDPRTLAWDAAMQGLYAGQPLGKTILGTEKTVSALSIADIRSYLRSRYLSANMSFIATGGFDSKKLLEQLRRESERLSESKAGGNGEGEGRWGRFRQVATHQPHGGDMRISRSGREMEHIAVALPAPERSSEYFPAAAALGLILGDDFGSVFFDEIIRKGYAESASAEYLPFSDGGAFFILISARAGGAEAVAEKALECYLALTRNPRLEEYVTRAKLKLRMQEYMGADTTLGRLEQLAWSVSCGIQPEGVEESCERYESLEKSRLIDYLNKYPAGDGKIFIVTVGPG